MRYSSVRTVRNSTLKSQRDWGVCEHVCVSGLFISSQHQAVRTHEEAERLGGEELPAATRRCAHIHVKALELPGRLGTEEGEEEMRWP